VSTLHPCSIDDDKVTACPLPINECRKFRLQPSVLFFEALHASTSIPKERGRISLHGLPAAPGAARGAGGRAAQLRQVHADSPLRISLDPGVAWGDVESIDVAFPALGAAAPGPRAAPAPAAPAPASLPGAAAAVASVPVPARGPASGAQSAGAQPPSNRPPTAPWSTPAAPTETQVTCYLAAAGIFVNIYVTTAERPAVEAAKRGIRALYAAAVRRAPPPPPPPPPARPVTRSRSGPRSGP
jgi:hypothetical protein